MNDIENSEQKLTDTAKSVDWSGEVDKTNKGNCQCSLSKSLSIEIKLIQIFLFSLLFRQVAQ